MARTGRRRRCCWRRQRRRGSARPTEWTQWRNYPSSWNSGDPCGGGWDGVMCSNGRWRGQTELRRQWSWRGKSCPMAVVAVEIVNRTPMWQSCHARFAGVANCLNILKDSVMVSL
uniref:Leucine-rich repeat-containing N-terminal plant-type domain-containing protein n=1 Tax=Oryza barthii TaxID=65489 RepID=A0A0D3G945_9ORYZ